MANMVMDLTKRMNDFRLASRDLYNQYFYSIDREEAMEAEERHSNLLEYLFECMVLQPEEVKRAEYFEVNHKIVVSLRGRSSGCYVIEVEVTPGSWSREKISCVNNSPELYFQCFFDWDELGVKDNKYVKGVLSSCPGAEQFVGKECLFEASDVLFKKA